MNDRLVIGRVPNTNIHVTNASSNNIETGVDKLAEPSKNDNLSKSHSDTINSNEVVATEPHLAEQISDLDDSSKLDITEDHSTAAHEPIEKSELTISGATNIVAIDMVAPVESISKAADNFATDDSDVTTNLARQKNLVPTSNALHCATAPSSSDEAKLMFIKVENSQEVLSVKQTVAQSISVSASRKVPRCLVERLPYPLEKDVTKQQTGTESINPGGSNNPGISQPTVLALDSHKSAAETFKKPTSVPFAVVNSEKKSSETPNCNADDSKTTKHHLENESQCLLRAEDETKETAESIKVKPGKSQSAFDDIDRTSFSDFIPSFNEALSVDRYASNNENGCQLDSTQRVVNDSRLENDNSQHRCAPLNLLNEGDKAELEDQSSTTTENGAETLEWVSHTFAQYKGTVVSLPRCSEDDQTSNDDTEAMLNSKETKRCQTNEAVEDNSETIVFPKTKKDLESFENTEILTSLEKLDTNQVDHTADSGTKASSIKSRSISKSKSSRKKLSSPSKVRRYKHTDPVRVCYHGDKDKVLSFDLEQWIVQESVDSDENDTICSLNQFREEEIDFSMKSPKASNVRKKGLPNADEILPKIERQVYQSPSKKTKKLPDILIVKAPSVSPFVTKAAEMDKVKKEVSLRKRRSGSQNLDKSVVKVDPIKVESSEKVNPKAAKLATKHDSVDGTANAILDVCFLTSREMSVTPNSPNPINLSGRLKQTQTKPHTLDRKVTTLAIKRGNSDGILDARLDASSPTVKQTGDTSSSSELIDLTFRPNQLKPLSLDKDLPAVASPCRSQSIDESKSVEVTHLTKAAMTPELSSPVHSCNGRLSFDHSDHAKRLSSVKESHESPKLAVTLKPLSGILSDPDFNNATHSGCTKRVPNDECAIFNNNKECFENLNNHVKKFLNPKLHKCVVTTAEGDTSLLSHCKPTIKPAIETPRVSATTNPLSRCIVSSAQPNFAQDLIEKTPVTDGKASWMNFSTAAESVTRNGIVNTVKEQATVSSVSSKFCPEPNKKNEVEKIFQPSPKSTGFSSTETCKNNGELSATTSTITLQSEESFKVAPGPDSTRSSLMAASHSTSSESNSTHSTSTAEVVQYVTKSMNGSKDSMGSISTADEISVDFSSSLAEKCNRQNWSTKRAHPEGETGPRVHKKPKRDIMLRYQRELQQSYEYPSDTSETLASVDDNSREAFGQMQTANNSKCDKLRIALGLAPENRNQVVLPIYGVMKNVDILPNSATKLQSSLKGYLQTIQQQDVIFAHNSNYLKSKATFESLSNGISKKQRKRKSKEHADRIVKKNGTTRVGSSSAASADKIYKCELCDFSTNKTGDLFTHSKQRHTEEEKVYICEKCGYITSRQSKLVAHEKSHEAPDADELEDERLLRVMAASQRAAHGIGGALVSFHNNSHKARKNKH